LKNLGTKTMYTPSKRIWRAPRVPRHAVTRHAGAGSVLAPLTIALRKYRGAGKEVLQGTFHFRQGAHAPADTSPPEAPGGQIRG
jgi:hypothetical protein